jgi:hypothetical protein
VVVVVVVAGVRGGIRGSAVVVVVAVAVGGGGVGVYQPVRADWWIGARLLSHIGARVALPNSGDKPSKHQE